MGIDCNPNYFSNKQWPSNDNVTYPYGKNHSLNGRYSFRIWDFTTNQEGIDVTQHKCLHKDPNKRKLQVIIQKVAQQEIKNLVV